MRKIILRAIVVGLSLTGIAICAFGGLLLYDTIDRVDSFHVLEAKLVNPRYLAELQLELPTLHRARFDRFGVQAHRVETGDGVVFGYRHYSNGRVLTIDDERYEKLTVWKSARMPLEGLFELAGNEDVVAIRSIGGSAWPRSDCSGVVAAGTVSIARAGRRFTVLIRGTLEPRGNQGAFGRCQREEINVQFETSKLEFAQLTPWLGSSADHIYSETYR